jgi:hypothetical protein
MELEISGALLPLLATVDIETVLPTVIAHGGQLLISRGALERPSIFRSSLVISSRGSTRALLWRQCNGALVASILGKGHSIWFLEIATASLITRLFLQQGKSASSIKCGRALNNDYRTNIISQSINKMSDEIEDVWVKIVRFELIDKLNELVNLLGHGRGMTNIAHLAKEKFMMITTESLMN